MNRARRFAVAIAAASVCALAAAPARGPQLTAAQRADAETITVPLLVDLYAGAPFRVDDLDEVLTRVNAIYEPARVRFTVVDARPEVAHPGDGDSDWTYPERQQLRDERRSYLDHLVGRLRGVSVNFTIQPKSARPGTNGLAYGESGVVILRPHPTGLTKTAETLAHELAHTLGLTDLYDDVDRDRLRYGYSSTRTGVALTPRDVREIRAVAVSRSDFGRHALAGSTASADAASSAESESSTSR